MKTTYKEGDLFKSSHGVSVELIKRLHRGRGIARVVGTNFNFEVNIQNLSRGSFKTPFCKTVYGVGFLGETKLSNLKDVPSYVVWSNMIKRCYSTYKGNRSQHCYEDVEVDSKWHNFHVFHEWYTNKTLKFIESGVAPKLDKDLLGEGKRLYSPDTCCILPHSINCALIESKKKGDLPFGLTRKRNKYSGTITTEYSAKSIGSYFTVEDAVEAYSKEKIKSVQFLANKYHSFLEQHVYDKLMNWKPCVSM